MKQSDARGRGFLLLLLLIATVLVALVVMPFVGALFTAAVFAAVLRPVQERVAGAFGGRPRLAAGTIVVGLSLAVILPVVWVTYIAGQQAAELVGSTVKVVEDKGVSGLIEDLPDGLQPMAHSLAAKLPFLLPDSAAGADPLSKVDVGAVVGTVTRVTKSVLTWAVNLGIDIGVMLIGLFFMLAQGRALVQWVVEASPLPDEQTQRFVDELKDVTIAVFTSTVLVALIQTAIAAVGYLLAGTPSLLVVMLVTLVASFIPALGAATVVTLVGLGTWAAGDSSWGIFLVVWGLVPVALSDNILKPLLAQGRLRLPGAVLFFAMLGGLALMGPMGVIAGPLILAFFLVVLRALKEGRANLPSAGNAEQPA